MPRAWAAASCRGSPAKVKTVQHAHCWVHVRRKFLDAEPVRAWRRDPASDAACEAAEANAAVSQARIGVTEARLDKTRLIAPFAGGVAEINGELNEYVTPSPIGIATPPAIDLIDNTCFYLIAPIDEGEEVGRISIRLEGEEYANRGLVALEAVTEAGFFGRTWDSMALWFDGLFEEE